MRRSALALAAMTAFFAALWLPLGQEAFLAEHWMKIGAFAAPMLLFLAFTLRDADAGPIGADVKLLATFLAAAYMLHQVEEHWVDALGRLYPLRDFLNETLAQAFGPEAADAMTPQAIFFINTSVVWLIAFIAIWAAPSHLFPTLAMAGVVLVNGVAHIAAAIVNGAYNPGLATAVLVFLPLSLVVFRAAWAGGRVGWTEIIAGIGWGVLAHGVLIAGLLAANVHRIIPVEAYYAALILWAIAPIFAFRRSSSAAPAR